MKLAKKILPLLLILALCFASTGSAFAASSTKGGTWYATDIVTDDSVSNSQIPMKIVYLPYSEVENLHNLPTNSLDEAILVSGGSVLTAKLAASLGTKFGLKLVPYAGAILTLAEWAECAQSDKFNKGINKAYKAKTGMVLTVYEAGSTGVYNFKCSNWTDGKTMPAKVYFTDISGYVKGAVTIGHYNINLNDPFED